MRNNTKLKTLLNEYDLNFTLEAGEIQIMVVERESQTTFLVHGMNITKLLDQALKYSKEVKAQKKTLE